MIGSLAPARIRVGQARLVGLQSEHLHEQRNLILFHLRRRRFSDRLKALLQVMTAPVGLAIAGGIRWAEEIFARPALKRGRMVNRAMGPLENQLRERHDASDVELRTQDKLEPAEAS